MCGRYVSVHSDDDLVELYGAHVVGDPVPPSWNVAPTDPARQVVLRRPSQHTDPPHTDPPHTDPPPADAPPADELSGRSSDPDAPVVQLRTARWGLVPSWSKTATGGAKLINARSETLTSKFRVPAGRRRSLTPSLGYYEWARSGTDKVPYFLHEPSGGPLAFASLYDIWRNPALAEDDPAAWLWTFTIITRAATDALGHIHDRSPVMVPPEMQRAWLDCSADDPAVASALLAQIPPPELVPRRVGAAVGNVRNNGPELIEAVLERPPPEPVQLSLLDD